MECWGRAGPFPCIASGQMWSSAARRPLRRMTGTPSQCQRPTMRPASSSLLCHATAARWALINLSSKTLPGELSDGHQLAAGPNELYHVEMIRMP